MKRFAARFFIGTLTLAAAMGFAVSSDMVSAKKVKVKKVTVDDPYSKTAEVAKGKKITLKTTVKATPNKKANKKVTYKVANKKIASVSAKGVVKGKKAGKTKVTVASKKNKKKKTTVKVVVKKSAVKKVKLNSQDFSLAVKGKKTLKATITPNNASKKVAWSSSNSKIAKVSDKGVVQGKKEGTAKITAAALDGSKKKATVKVTVGTGIDKVTIPTSDIVKIGLTSTAALKASDIKIETRTADSGNYNVTKDILRIETTDNKNYDVKLASGISDYSYVKVSIPSLKGTNSKEIYVSVISGYLDSGTEKITFVTGEKGDIVDNVYSISNSNATGSIKITGVAGSPAGVNVHTTKSGTAVSFVGKYANVENGTTVTLTGTDEAGKTFTRKLVFYVGDENTIVGTVIASTRVAYIPADPKNPKSEAYGDDFSMSTGTKIVLAGASLDDDDYDYVLEGVPSTIATVDEDGYLHYVTDANGRRAPIPAGTYNLKLNVTSGKVSVSIPFNMTFVQGVTVSGTVKDAAGQPAKYAMVGGYTKDDAYGMSYSFGAQTDENGKYTTMVLPGDYYTYCSASGSYYGEDDYGISIYDDASIGNNFTAGTVSKDFTLSSYRVDVTTDIPGAVGYGYFYGLSFVDIYGDSVSVKRVTDEFSANYGKMYAYLRPGTYRSMPTRDTSEAGVVSAYGEITQTDMEGYPGLKEYILNKYIDTYKLAAAADFTVSGNTTVQLKATQWAEPTPEPEPTLEPTPTPELEADPTDDPAPTADSTLVPSE